MYIRFKNKRVKKYFRSGLIIITWPSFLDRTHTHSHTDTHRVFRILNFEFRILNICFDFFICACLWKTATNIWNSTHPNWWATKDKIGQKQYGKNKHYPIFSLSKDLSICFWVWNIKKSNMLCTLPFLPVLQNMEFQF